MGRKALLTVFGSICLVLVFATMPFLSACPAPSEETTTPPQPTGEETTSPPAVKPIKIGAILAMTGGCADWGRSFKVHDQFAIYEFGGEVAGRPIEYIYEDDACIDATKAIDAAKKLVELDKVDVVLGPVVDCCWQAVRPYVLEKGLPLIAQANRSGNIELWQPGEKRMDFFGLVRGMESSALGPYLYEERGIRKLATLTMDEACAYTYIGALVDSFTKAGGTVVSQQWAPWGTIDFGPYFLEMQDAGADALAFWLYGEMPLLMIRQFHEFGLGENIDLVLANGDDIRVSHLQELGDSCLGMYGAVAYEPTIPTKANEEFIAAFQSWAGEPPNKQGVQAYEALKGYLLAVEATGGDTTPTAVRDAMIGLSYESPTGDITWTDRGYQARNVFIAEVQKVDGELIWQWLKTVYVSEAPPEYPKP